MQARVTKAMRTFLDGFHLMRKIILFADLTQLFLSFLFAKIKSEGIFYSIFEISWLLYLLIYGLPSRLSPSPDDFFDCSWNFFPLNDIILVLMKAGLWFESFLIGRDFRQLDFT